jgi:pseudaminic acid biosynthesis-associated methylase
MTKQEELWNGIFGDEYAVRNPSNMNDMDKLYIELFNISRTDINKEVIGNIDKNIKILEVGCNTGAQLNILKNMGFIDLHGLELSIEPLLEAKKLHPKLNLIQGNAINTPYKDKYFDMVFTSGVLIHINEENLNKAMDEMYRVSKKYIWCYEYFSEEREMIKYRGIDNVLWKDNFCKKFMERFPDLQLVKSKKVKYIKNDNVDEMFLLVKTSI